MILKKNDINTGRQVEFDYLKGLFVPMIIIVHAFQMLGGTAEPLYEVFYPICTMTGSAIFLFVMGLGSVYSRRSEKQMVIAGLRLILWQIAWNLFALALPLLLGQGIRAMLGCSMELWPVVVEQTKVFAQYINIFFIAGAAYLLLALFRKLKLPGWGYLALAVAVMAATPFLYMTDWSTDIPAADYLLALFLGGRDHVSLVFLPHLAYTLFGVWFGQILRRTADKKGLYLRVVPGALVIGAAYIVYAILTSSSLTDFCTFMSEEYVFPGIFRMLANLSFTLAAAAALYALSARIGRISLLNRILLHFNRKTTAYYAIHPFLYALTGSIAAMAPFGWLPCIALAVVNTVLCRLVIRLRGRMRGSEKKLHA